ncbi:MAG: DUF3786 domain-containing protein [Thermodesulfobacteriota bacterium]
MKPYVPQMPPGSRWAEDLPGHFWKGLENRAPELAAAATRAELDRDRFILPVFARPYLVDPQNRRVQDLSQTGARVDYNTALVLVTHLARAVEAPPSGLMISFNELPGGRALVTGPHALPLDLLAERFGGNHLALGQRARALGGEEIEGADMAVRLPGLPRVPMYLLLWLADEDFPAQAVPGVDAGVMQHLDLDGLLSLSHLMVQRLTETDQDHPRITAYFYLNVRT